MEKVIEACQSSTHALLESPTGTGKTAGLLCAVLAWTTKEVQRIQLQLAAIIADGPHTTALSSMHAHQAMMADITRTTPAASSPFPSTSTSSPSLPSVPLPHSSPSPFAPVPAYTRPRIIYSSRTHSQLSKVISELKRTTYRPKMTLLGSRQQLCVHPDVRQLTGIQQNHACHALVNAHDCLYYENLAGVVAGRKGGSAMGLAMDSCMDLEELLRYGEDHRVCPYFSTREVLPEAELVLLPYNYLIDGSIRDKLQLNLQGSVVIFDEAHNLEQVCVEAASFDLTALDIAAAVNEVDRCIEEVTAADEQRKQQEAHDPWSNRHTATTAATPDLASLAILKQLLLELDTTLDKHELRDADKGETRSGEYMFELLERCKISFRSKDALLQLLDEAVEFLLRCEDSALGSRRRTSSALAKLAGVFRLVYVGDEAKSKEVARDYRVHIHQRAGRKKPWAGAQQKKAAPMPTPPRPGSTGTGLFQQAHKPSPPKLLPTDDDDPHPSSSSSSSYRVLSYWCFNPGLSMATLSACGVRSFLFTSGTLSPLDTFASEFQLSFPIRLENAHIIPPHHILLSVIERGPAGHPLLSSYSNRSNAAYVSDLGAAVVNVCRVVPDGVLVFFPSYFALEGCRDEWERGGVMARIRALKVVVVEPRVSAEFSAAIGDYQAAIVSAKKERGRGGGGGGGVTGAIFFAVCRGKVSEGLDFADANGRAVIITGLPFPALHEPKVRIKREFLDQQRSIAASAASSSSSSFSSSPHPPPSLLLTGNAWYQQQASRAVNQAIGRVIRHSTDYGAILLLDQRFASLHQQQQLSAWVRQHVSVHHSFASAVQPLRGFFKRLEAEGMGGVVEERVTRVEVGVGGMGTGEGVGKRKEGGDEEAGWRMKRGRRDADSAEQQRLLAQLPVLATHGGGGAGRVDASSSSHPMSFRTTSTQSKSVPGSLLAAMQAQGQT